MRLVEKINKDAKKIILVDFSNLLYISSFSKFSKSTGPNVGVILYQLLWKYQKVIKWLKKDLKVRYSETPIILAADRKSKIRAKVYKEYKEHRKQNKLKITYKEAVFAASSLFLTHIPNISAYAEDSEADDVINKIVKKYHQEKEIYILSRDRDLWQLLQYKNVKIFDFIKYKMYTMDDVYNAFKVPPEKIFIYKTIYGDKSDNIPSIFSEMGIRNTKGKKVLEVIRNKDNLQEILDEISNIYNLNPELSNKLKELAARNLKLVMLYEPKVNLAYSNTNENRYLNVLKEYNISKYPEFEIFKESVKFFRK